MRFGRRLGLGCWKGSVVPARLGRSATGSEVVLDVLAFSGAAESAILRPLAMGGQFGFVFSSAALAALAGECRPASVQAEQAVARRNLQRKRTAPIQTPEV